jgi:hypothetical protein
MTVLVPGFPVFRARCFGHVRWLLEICCVVWWSIDTEEIIFVPCHGFSDIVRQIGFIHDASRCEIVRKHVSNLISATSV